MRRAVGAALLLVAVLGAAACSTSSPAAQQSQLPPSVAPTTPTFSTPAVSTPAPSPSSNAKPLSAFEKDPAVQALRAWADRAARAVNAGKGYGGAALTALETPTFVPLVKNVFASDKGLRYPGPVPFTPIKVASPSATERQLSVCFVAYGFAVDPKTQKPPKKLTLFAANVPMIRSGTGRWRVDHLQTTNSFSCRGVKVALIKW